ncbi:hypothetical protein MTP99_013257 [Tenebrio molitor]|nr:hypothetical protein MTP99_013257 [Tenebrio molitor]
MSHVWKHFTKTIDKNKSNTVKCNYCGNQYSRGGNNSRNFNTSNLTKHLKRCSKYNTETSAAIKRTLNSAQTSQSQTLHSKFDAHNAELEEVNPHDADDAQMEDDPTTNLFVPEATALDPRYKAQLFSDETKDELKDLLKENYPLRYADDHEKSPQQYQEFDSLDKTEEAGTITLFAVTKKLLLSKNKSDEHSTGTTSKNKNIDRDIENEISVYFHERTEPLESDPVEFWKKEIRLLRAHLRKRKKERDGGEGVARSFNGAVKCVLLIIRGTVGGRRRGAAMGMLGAAINTCLPQFQTICLVVDV